MKAPSPPDPVATARAQFHANTGTAVAQQVLNQTNQVTPFSSLTYDQTGSYKLTDPRTGRSVDIPQFTATQSSPMLEGLRDYINSPFDPNTATEDKLTGYGRQFLDPMWDQRAQSYESDLLNRGLGMGTEAYRNAMRDFGDQRSRAYNDMYLYGQGQAFNQAMQERARPIQEVLSALSGTPFGATPNAGIAPPDYQGAVQANYQQRLANYNNSVGALTGLVGTVARGAFGGWGG